MTRFTSVSDAIRIANCSGFMGDRFLAAKQMVNGGPIDALTGDYLAELTMGILKTSQTHYQASGYADNFFFQAQQVLQDCLEKNIKIVVNAGGINPAGLADELKKFAVEKGLQANIAYIDGDNLVHRLEQLQSEGEEFCNIETGKPLAQCQRSIETANAYLGGWGIKTALDHGADVVIAPRTTDAALVIGLAAWKFQWQRDDYDKLAGALTAGHIIECGPQACGGNYSFFKEVPTFKNIGFPIAEISCDGSFVITKHEGTGGAVTVGTVTEQLLYETSTPAYLNPDVISHFDTLKIDDLGNDRVRVSNAKGSMPPEQHKVCITTFGGYKTTYTNMIAGLDAEQKARLLVDEMMTACGGRDSFDSVTEELIPCGHSKPSTNEEAFSMLRVTVKSQDPNKVGPMFVHKELELTLSNIPGMVPASLSGMGSPESLPFMVHWPALVDSRHILERVYVNDDVIDVLPTSQMDVARNRHKVVPAPVVDLPGGKKVSVPFGRVYGTRSGDKGGNANLGVYARSDEAYSYLRDYLSVERFKELMPDTQLLRVDRFELNSIRSMNFYVHGYLQEGVASSTRIDGCGKSFGEYLGCQIIEVPESILQLEGISPIREACK